LHRLLQELVLLRGHVSWTPRRLSERLNVSERTIRRDIKKLTATGFNVRFNRKRSEYRLEGESFLPPVALSLDEALALIVLCEDVAGRGQVGLLGAAVSALSKVESQLPDAMQQRLRDVMDSVSVRLAPSGSLDQESKIFEQMRHAIADRRVIRCQYRTPKRNSKGESFVFEPYLLWFGVRAWYVIGKYRRRNELAALKLRRFQSVELTRQPFQRPEGFTAEDYLRNAWQMIPGDRDYSVELLFDAAFAETVTDTRWHHTQESIRHDDGTATLRFTVSGLDEIVWWVLSMGRHCRVIKPRELVTRVQREVRAMRMSEGASEHNATVR
jgi:predicted DNA-binding transcriptional regulator YafY